VPEAILGSTTLIEQNRLGDMLDSSWVRTFAPCVNRDPRGPVKSGEIVANVLGKRSTGTKIYGAPAHAIEDGVARIALFEDGLWSGTEAIGVFESLLGLRDDAKLKTPKLADPARLASTEVVLVYALATDYGEALVRRFLDEKGLRNVSISSHEKVQVCSKGLLERLASGPFDLDHIRHNGPEPDELAPFVHSVLAAHSPDATQLDQARDFVQAVGLQLLDHYLDGMRKSHGWDAWPMAKKIKASVGMHGLGLTHAFGHSVPKASIPLLWSGGEVTVGKRSVRWKPLFANA
jgi:hypothetical protein